MPTTIVLIHGAWMNPQSWQGWIDLYESRGYEVVAPAWPYDDRPVAELRASPAPELAGVGVEEIVAHYERIVRAMPAPPILIGHSFGGLFVQMLLDRGLGAAGVAIDPAPPKGVMPSFNALRAAAPVLLNWGAGSRVLPMSYADFQWGWVHTLPEPEQRAAFEKYVVPTPGRLYVQGAAAPFTDLFQVNFANDKRAPLLLIAGEEDRTVTRGMVEATFQKQRRSAAKTELRTFPGRTHWIVAQPGWEEVAELALAWAEAQTGGALSPSPPPAAV
jgi:pimeloyl-ACP methyl ester carboxylesterase